MKRRKKIAILGSSPGACIYALHLSKNNENSVTVFEKKNSIGGAWEYDERGPKYSNIISPVYKSEEKLYLKAVNVFKSFRINFDKEPRKVLYASKITKAYPSDLKDFLNYAKKKLNIKFNTKILTLKAFGQRAIINDKYEFDLVYFPSLFNLTSIFLKNEEKIIEKKILTENSITATHLRVFCGVIKKNINEIFSDSIIGPLDRMQLSKIDEKIYRINGRISLDWKNRSKEDIINFLKDRLEITNIETINFFHYKSCIRNGEQINQLIKCLQETASIKYLETRSLLQFAIKNLF